MNKPRLSASRLNSYLGCAHSAALWLDGVKPPVQEDAGLELVRSKGFEHEAQVLAALEAQYGPAVAISDTAPLEDRSRQTQEAMAAGAPLIYQAALYNDRWVGFPDFLILTTQTPNGVWLYDPEDAKLARKAKPEHVVQLGVYRRLLMETTEHSGDRGAIHVAGGAPEAFDLTQTHHVTSRYMGQFEAFADAEARATRALPNAACGQCAYKTRCEAEWRAADSPTFVAGLRGDQLLKLEAAGFTTLTQLATLDPTARVAGIGAETLPKLVAQARLQREGVTAGAHKVELLDLEPRRGFALMPAPAPGDLFFDMEGYPHFPEGLEYLFGLWGPLGEGGADTFKGLWAHDRAAEKVAFEELIDLFLAHLGRYPCAHIYHYAPYEPVALKKLASRHATREAQLDQLLREQRFVDLYRIARQALRASTEGYSLKQLEKIYWGKREGEVTNAGDSMVEYENWRLTGEQQILDAIERYNEDDCVSTAKMRDWLEALRPAGGAYTGLEVGGPEAEPDERARAREAFERERQDLARRVRASQVGDEAFRDLVAELLWFHQRAQKPQWWALFDRQVWSDDELIEDLDGLGGLVLQSEEALPKPARSNIATYRFPPQDTKLRVGQTCRIAETTDPAGEIQELDAAEGLIVLKRGTSRGEFPQTCGISPDGPIDQKKLVAAVVAFAERIAAGDDQSDRATIDLLMRRNPNLTGRQRAQPILKEDEDLVAGALRAVRDLDHSYLFIQGPPGTGKTYTASHVIVDLVKSGARVAISSNSHKAIHNLLEGVETRASEAGVRFDGVKKASHGDPDSEFQGRQISNIYASGDAKPFHQLVAGTVFHFCSAPNQGPFDYLFVDEAGQVCLANLMAMGACARNIVLVGDQMQLPQPVQGVHPGETGLSCLDYLLQGRATVPPEQGILLNVTWRMHPKLCSLISDAIYDGRLVAHPTTALREVLGIELLPPAGVMYLPVAHEGCRQSSVEEANIVARLVAELMASFFRDKDGTERQIGLDDILVVAPYNMQVNLLKANLPAQARVGTVDKFQGQEAVVVIISMATSNGAEAPRGTEFLFNRNRLNVAISRAKCLAIMVCGELLLDASVVAIEDLVRLDLLARVEALSLAAMAELGEG
jgi:predicted RecB family nuclease